MTLFTILIIALHVFAIYHVFNSLKKIKGGASRFVFAFFPPLLGPLIYFFTIQSAGREKRTFMDGKRRFSK